LKLPRIRLVATLAVLAGYLASDALLDGVAAAAAVIALGVAEFLLLLVIPGGGRHPGLMVEAAVLAGAGLLGDVLSKAGYPRTGYAILEILLGGFLLGSALAGRPWLAGKLEETGLRANRTLVTESSTVLGGLFLLHGLFLAAMTFLAGGLRTFPAIASFAVLYILALLVLRRRGRARAILTAPRLVQEGEGRYRILKGDQPMAAFALDPSPRPVVRDLVLEEGIPPHKVLEALEATLTAAGARTITLRDWPGDSLDLGMAGYTEGPAGWTKPLRGAIRS
jgi:hypothetical protein